VGARLTYAKVIDRERFYIRGGKIHPGLDNEVLVDDEPGKAGAFLVLRAWSNEHGTFTEQWRIRDPEGALVYEGLPREIHIASDSHVERLEDEVAELDFEYTADDYQVVFALDEREVARVRFSVKLVR
jgi:hypothetical protein